MLVRWIIELAPHQQPDESQYARHQKCRSPTPMKVDPQHYKGRERPPYRRATIEECRCERPLLRREPFRHSLGCGGPVCRLSKPKHETKSHEGEESVCQRRQNRDQRVK